MILSLKCQKEQAKIRGKAHPELLMYTGPPTRNLVERIAGTFINGRESSSRSIPLEEHISRLKTIVDSGADLNKYIAELEQLQSEEHNASRTVSSIVDSVKGHLSHNRQVILDGHQAGGKVTAIIAAATLATGAGLYLRLDHAPSRPKPKKETSKNGQSRSA